MSYFPVGLELFRKRRFILGSSNRMKTQQSSQQQQQQPPQPNNHKHFMQLPKMPDVTPLTIFPWDRLNHTWQAEAAQSFTITWRFTPLGQKGASTTYQWSTSTKLSSNQFWLVVSTHLKNISQIGSSHQVGVKIQNI